MHKPSEGGRHFLKAPPSPGIFRNKGKEIPHPQISSFKKLYFPRNNDICQDNKGKLGLPEIDKKELMEIEADGPVSGGQGGS